MTVIAIIPLLFYCYSIVDKALLVAHDTVVTLDSEAAVLIVKIVERWLAI